MLSEISCLLGQDSSVVTVQLSQPLCPHHSTEATLVSIISHLPLCCPNLKSLLCTYLNFLHSVAFSTSLAHPFSSLSTLFLGFTCHLSEDDPPICISSPSLPLEFQTHISSYLLGISKTLSNIISDVTNLTCIPFHISSSFSLLILSHPGKNVGVILDSSTSLTTHIASFSKPVNSSYKHVPNLLLSIWTRTTQV